MSELAMVRRMAEGVRDRTAEYLESHGDYDEVVARRSTDITRRIDMVAEEAMDELIRGEGIAARVVSEELGERVVPEKEAPECTLILDPVDGSANLSMGIPYYCTSLAFSPKARDAAFADVEAGAVAAAWGRTFYASKGCGAFYGGERLAVREHPEKPRYVLYAYGVGPLPGPLVRLAGERCLVRTMGSIALDMCYVAKGSLDAIVDSRDRISGYDVLAAALVLREAGGVLTDYSGRDMSGLPVTAGGFSVLGAAGEALHRRLLGRLHTADG